MKTPISIAAILAIAGCLYGFMPGPRAWPSGAWDAADHNRDGQLTRAEMVHFGQQKTRRNAPRRLWHFDQAAANSDGVVDDDEVKAYESAVASKDTNDHLPPPVGNSE